jgi:hypothetical protein
MNKWISVDDRFPSTDQECFLIYNPTSSYAKIQIAQYFGKGDWSINRKFITHWMLPPNPPKG